MQQERAINLNGGPYHGKGLWWNGGDIFEVQEMPPLKITSKIEAIPREIKCKRGYYRERAHDPRFFDWQGWL